MKNLNRMRFCK